MDFLNKALELVHRFLNTCHIKLAYISDSTSPKSSAQPTTPIAGYIRYCSHIYGYFNADMEDYVKTKRIESQFEFWFDR